jgi:hypothetical protein
MMAAGLSAEQIIAVTKAALIAEQAKAEADQERRRADNVARQQRYRDRRKAVTNVTHVTRDERYAPRDVTQGDVTPEGNVTDVTQVTRDAPLLSPNPKGSSSSSLPPSPPTGAQTPAQKPSRGSAIPADWKPKSRHYEAALRKGYGRDWVDDQGEAMREWAEGNRNRQVARKADWDRTFDGWLRREMAKAQGPPKKQPRYYVP